MPQYEVIIGDRAVWVNADTGECIGRFGVNGMDVHRRIADQHLGECISCSHTRVTVSDWNKFVQLMKEHHNVDISGVPAPVFVFTGQYFNFSTGTVASDFIGKYVSTGTVASESDIVSPEEEEMVAAMESHTDALIQEFANENTEKDIIDIMGLCTAMIAKVTLIIATIHDGDFTAAIKAVQLILAECEKHFPPSTEKE